MLREHLPFLKNSAGQKITGFMNFSLRRNKKYV